MRATTSKMLGAGAAAALTALAMAALAPAPSRAHDDGRYYGRGGTHYEPGYGYYSSGEGRRYDRRRARPSWWDQRDKPGVYGCDAYWDRGRTDCEYGPDDGSGRYYPDTGYRGYRRSDGYDRYDRGYGYGLTERQAWCASRYRSYNPETGYYLGYDGRYHYCG